MSYISLLLKSNIFPRSVLALAISTYSGVVDVYSLSAGGGLAIADSYGNTTFSDLYFYEGVSGTYAMYLQEGNNISSYYY